MSFPGELTGVRLSSANQPESGVGRIFVRVQVQIDQARSKNDGHQGGDRGEFSDRRHVDFLSRENMVSRRESLLFDAAAVCRFIAGYVCFVCNVPLRIERKAGA